MRPCFVIPLLVGVLTGCTVGPNYGGPPKMDAGSARPFVRAGGNGITQAPPIADWWTTLSDPLLNTLITRALAGSTDVKAGEARLRQARAALGEQRANQSPKLDGSALYAHARVPGANLGDSDDTSGGDGGDSSLNLYNLGFNASWEIDLFGSQRRAVEAARASMEGAEASLADVQVSLSANIARNYLNLRDRQQRIALEQQSAVMREDMLALTRQRFSAGTGTAADVAQAESQIAATRARIALLGAERDSYLNALAVLIGQEPGALDGELSSPADIPLPPASIPIGDPAGLIAHRPDIRAAERRLASDTAKIGQAEAARFPRLSFMGLIGIGGTKIGDLSHLDDFVALGAPQLSWSFLDFGRNKSRLGQAEATRDEAEARYRGTVLAALQDAEDSLARFRERRVAVAALARVRDKAALTADLTQQRYRAGTATRTAAIDARNQLNGTEQDLVSAKAALTADYVAIQKALGLAWK